MSAELKVREYITLNEMIVPGDCVVAGVSGGADSMCMLLMLLLAKKDIPFDIEVIHINHGIRGESADNDERFVEGFCKEQGIAFHAIHANIPEIAKKEHMTAEEAGRNFRYDAFADVASRIKAEKINANVKVAVAHNSDDNVETVLFNIFRGSGITGICGIRPVKQRKTKHGDITIIRPVLCLCRSEIEEYVKSKNISFCTDETNLTNDYSRNYIRNVVLPGVKENLNCGVMEHLSNLSNRAIEVEDFLQYEAKKYIVQNVVLNNDVASINIDSLLILHKAVQGIVLRTVLEHLSQKLKDIEQRHIDLLVKHCSLQNGRRLDLPYELQAYTEYGKLTIRRKKNDEDLSKHQIDYRILDYDKKGKIPTDGNEKWFDFDLIKGSLTIRKRQDGDYLLIGKNGHRKSLNRYFIDNKVPVAERDSIEVLAEGSHVLFVAGMRRDDSFYVTDNTKRILVVTSIS